MSATAASRAARHDAMLSPLLARFIVAFSFSCSISISRALSSSVALASASFALFIV